MTFLTVEEWYASTRVVGNLVIFLIIGVPVYLSVLTSVFEPPRNFRMTGIFLGMIVTGVIAFVITFAVLGTVLSFFVP